MQNTTITPCQYHTGQILGSGTYSIVREAIHIDTNQVYACKIINKQRMAGREYLIRNEIAVLERISGGHPNIVTLQDYFESPRNMYLCFDLCTGGELFNQICSKRHYYETDAASLVRTVLTALKYIHDAGIVHRDLKPENLLFRTEAEDADIMITDFGLSRVMDDEKLALLTGMCGTPGYMAPEIFFDTAHGKPVDVWAMGVITYFLLVGYVPFDRDTPEAEMQAIITGDYAFAPAKHWANVSETARDFVQACLTVDPARRPTAAEALEHRWLTSATPHFVADPSSPTGGPVDLLPHVKKALNGKRTCASWKLAGFGIRAMNRFASLSFSTDKLIKEAANVQRLKQKRAQKPNHDDIALLGGSTGALRNSIPKRSGGTVVRGPRVWGSSKIDSDKSRSSEYQSDAGTSHTPREPLGGGPRRP